MQLGHLQGGGGPRWLAAGLSALDSKYFRSHQVFATTTLAPWRPRVIDNAQHLGRRMQPRTY